VPGTEDTLVPPPGRQAMLSRREKWFAAAVLLTVVVLGAGNLASSYMQNKAFQRQFTMAQQQAAATQRKTGALIEAKLCSTLLPVEALARLTPPPGDPAKNPSRAFEQKLIVTLAPLAQLGADIGCRR
jgi:hypothetical protein